MSVLIQRPPVFLHSIHHSRSPSAPGLLALPRPLHAFPPNNRPHRRPKQSPPPSDERPAPKALDDAPAPARKPRKSPSPKPAPSLAEAAHPMPLLHSQPAHRLPRQRRAQHKQCHSASLPAPAVVAIDVRPAAPTPTPAPVAVAAPAPVPIPATPKRRAVSSPVLGRPAPAVSTPPMSRSVPTGGKFHAPPRSNPGVPDWDSPAAEPDMTWQQAALKNGPRTAPIDGKMTPFPLLPESPSPGPRHQRGSPPASPSRSPVQRHAHVRRPSYGDALFDFEEETPEAPAPAPLAMPFPAPVYAGPTFHNSPMPSALPPPKFLVRAH
ncbi:hypothetical protein BOTBODRAFT_37372 [Botryobasidium botryosum FD-172 SS1]|uniref:Uncharacterized protein n=1 Tax=Botryobasidium botryosum (strain FD-172 SS1) TaxID=930990 RepID=A0A067MB70_BOTB1|nr:hypothetical protein BOTBODRAFT_37372 [Botryobasidium botryosum FD-172 SS1]